MFRFFRGRGLSAGLATLALLAGLGASVTAPGVHARSTTEAPAGTAAHESTVVLSELPSQARQTHRLILQGGPFPYAKDGTVFGNRERLLPRHPRGFYREYTVRTPGLSHRGARRIVCGGWEASQPEHCYYTADHYASFRRIVP